ncbi:MAG: ATP-binding protein [Deltaproteobacteria bacterium]|nr:MAG: ATP-binding protein [Deltaproteobacteria bacterium]
MARELVIFVGLQAAGKSSFFRERFGATHAHVSKDLMPRAVRDKESRQLGQIEQALLIGRPVVVDNTNPRAADRAPLIELARRYEARVVGYFFEPRIQDSIRRNEARQPQVPKVARGVQRGPAREVTAEHVLRRYSPTTQRWYRARDDARVYRPRRVVRLRRPLPLEEPPHRRGPRHPDGGRR